VHIKQIEFLTFSAHFKQFCDVAFAQNVFLYILNIYLQKGFFGK